MLAKRYPLTSAPSAPAPKLNSELGTALDRVVRQQATTRTVLAVAAVGPLAVAVALVVLAARLVVQRRKPWLELLRARGLTTRQSRGLAAAEGALLAIPAAMLGHVAALALIPGPRPWWGWVGPVLVAAIAVGALTLTAAQVGEQRGRSDLSAKGGRWRLVAEALTVAAALAATWRMLTRPAADPGLDLLAAVTPVAWTVVASLLVLRLYPLPLGALARSLARGRALTGFLGAVRAKRDPAGGTVPVVAVLLGATLAVMGATLLGTITTGTERAAWETNGAQINLSGPTMTDDLVASLEAIVGVGTVARLYEGNNNAGFEAGGVKDRVWLLLAEPTLLDAYAATPGGSPIPARLFDEPSLIVGGELDAEGTATVDGLGSLPIIGHVDVLPGATSGAKWVLADKSRFTGGAPRSVVALIAIAPGSDAQAVADRVAEAVPNSRVSTAAADLEALRTSPTIDGLTRTFLILAGATVALMALAVVGSQLLTGGERNHLAAILRTLGLRPGQLRALTAGRSVRRSSSPWWWASGLVSAWPPSCWPVSTSVRSPAEPAPPPCTCTGPPWPPPSSARWWRPWPWRSPPPPGSRAAPTLPRT